MSKQLALYFIIATFLFAAGDSVGAPKPSSINTMGNVLDNRGIVTQGQVGNNTIVLNLAPIPEVKFSPPAGVEKRGDGTVYRYFTMEVVTSTPPGNIVVGVEGKSVTSVEVNPITQGTVQFGHWEKGDMHYVKIATPFGKYQLLINTTDEKEVPSVAFGLNL